MRGRGGGRSGRWSRRGLTCSRRTCGGITARIDRRVRGVRGGGGGITCGGWGGGGSYPGGRWWGAVAAVVRASGRERAHFFGHDWGGIIPCPFAGLHPEL